MEFSLWDEPGRKPIRVSVKREVYKRARGRCERCGKDLPFSGGATCYHHTRKPTVSPTAKTVQLLCRNCHAEHGHKYKTVTHDKGWITETKVTNVIRKKVKTKRKPVKKKTKRKKARTKRRVTRKKVTKKRTRRKRSKKSLTRKKRKTTKRSAKRKRKTTKRKIKRRKK